MSRPKRSIDPILGAHICPYCQAAPEYVDSAAIYGRSYGMVYLCRKCNAYVGVHIGTDIPLGRLATAELRELKKQAHKYFDMLWKGRDMTRHEAYRWLSGVLSLPKSQTHIGMFDEKQCADAVYFCKQLLNDLRRLDLDFGAEPKTPLYQ